MAGPANADFMLAPDDVHVWSVELDRSADELAELATALTPAERARAERLVSAQLRGRALAGRGALRTLLGDYLDCAPGEVALVQGAHGKPTLATGRLRFNVAHTRDLALIAVAHRDVGIDVEPTDRTVEVDAVAARFFAAAERAALAALPPERRLDAFLEIWTRKEAYVKARGDGIAAGLRGFAVTVGPSPRLAPIGDTLDTDGWTIHHLAPAPGFVGALVVRGRQPATIRLRAWRGG